MQHFMRTNVTAHNVTILLFLDLVLKDEILFKYQGQYFSLSILSMVYYELCTAGA